MSELPALCGVIDLAPLPSSPRWGGSMEAVLGATARDAEALAAAGFDALVVENFGDTPFEPGEVDPAAVAALTRCAVVAREAAPALALGINVLRNDARAALGVAAAAGAAFVRVNVHVGARLTDQGVIAGAAHATLRRRRALGLDGVKLFCDVAVKHSAPLAPRPIGEEAAEAVERGLADAILVTGAGTGKEAADDDLRTVIAAVAAPVYAASGASVASLPRLLGLGVHGVVVGSALRKSGRAGEPIDADVARRFADAFRRYAG